MTAWKLPRRYKSDFGAVWEEVRRNPPKKPRRMSGFARLLRALERLDKGAGAAQKVGA